MKTVKILKTLEKEWKRREIRENVFQLTIGFESLSHSAGKKNPTA